LQTITTLSAGFNFSKSDFFESISDGPPLDGGYALALLLKARTVKMAARIRGIGFIVFLGLSWWWL
jgi:hypothetical protein